VNVRYALPMVLRRMRMPLIILISVYALSILGLVLIPGQDDAGEPWAMSFFHAFYFVSFMGSTIGFGEIPYPFTDAQRMWTSAMLYATVFSWLYTIGALIGALQDTAVRHAIGRSAFRRQVSRIREPFHLVCGHGDTGANLVRGLAARGIRAVVVDIRQEAVDALALADLPLYVPGLRADARDPEALRLAGLDNPHCAGVVALTNDDRANLKVAITAKLLRPRLRVTCRAETAEVGANMASFGTDRVLNPFELFAGHLVEAVESPAAWRLAERLGGLHRGSAVATPVPPRGTWVVVGFGRFGKAVQSRLEAAGVPTVVVEPDPAAVSAPADAVAGTGTGAAVLREAGIENAAGLIAGTDDDADNLSVVMTARELNPEIFSVVRQNRGGNDAIFAAARIDVVMRRSAVIAARILNELTAAPLVAFLDRIRDEPQRRIMSAIERVDALVGEREPEPWVARIQHDDAPAICHALGAGATIRIGDILRDPRQRESRLSVEVLLLQRDGEVQLWPDDDTALESGDRLLLCSPPGVRPRLAWTLSHPATLSYVLRGEIYARGTLWRWLRRRRGATASLFE